MNGFAHMITVAALTTGAGVAFIRLGFGTGFLQPRQTRGRCQACGRSRGRQGCEHCGY